LIDRSEEAVQALTEKLLDLRERGGEIAAQMASLVNKQIILGAMLLADDTGETIVPETVHPHVANHTCGDCNGDGRHPARQRRDQADRPHQGAPRRHPQAQVVGLPITSPRGTYAAQMGSR
jgi:hypothetical protein